jgi:2-polyprenyl-3-methyl-5-hydroxy-6-metoxy-1,4-benzoquinol methylase
MIIKSKICNKIDFDTNSFKAITQDLKESYRYHRKLWEFVKIAEAVKTLIPNVNTTGLGFGVGEEPLPAYFASLGYNILATDQEVTTRNAKNWTQSNQICVDSSRLNSRGICNPEQFKDKVKFQNIDMNFIPTNLGTFDFVWSSCALEHLGTLQNGLWFIIRSLALLKPGGYAIHTTEYNLSSNTNTNFIHENCIYRKIDIDALASTIKALGHTMFEFDNTRGTHEYDLFVDPNGWTPKPPPVHLNLKIDEFDATSCILIIQKV